MRRWDRLMDGYLEECRGRGLAEETVANIGRALGYWGQWMKGRRPRLMLDRVSADVLVGYIESRSSFRAKATVYATLSTMRGMGDYLVRAGVWQVNPLRWMKGPKITPYSRMPRRIDRAHLEAMWREAAASPGEYRRLLWVTVLAMLYGTGLRRGELERLDVESFDRAEATFRIDGSKSGRERCVPVPEMLYRCLEAYLPRRHNVLEQAGAVGERALLVNRHGERLSGTSISRGVHAIARRARVPIYSVHQFRHSCASDLLEAGVHLAEVQRILGHQGIATTVRYTHIADPMRREAIGCHPLNDWLAQEAA
jgi:site-specific recombinase XerD